ncbi:MAG: hypothetical protein HY048_18655 [Acidobacteria bacterium]|nr:hypothetical protein [Acidobacteriota bacterium]
MSVKRTATIVVVGGALAAWLASAATSSREIAPAPITRTAPIEVRGAELAEEIARLHERLRPTAMPQSPGRNLFAFKSGGARPATAAPAPAPGLFFPAPPVVAAPDSGFRLSGLAEDPGPDGPPVRTAIISSPTQLFLVKEGDAVTARYRVAKIAADAVELADVNGGAPLRLVLK